MSIFDIFRTKKEIPTPWGKYYTNEQLNLHIPNISMYSQVLKSAKKYPNNIAYKYYNKKVTYINFIKQIDNAASSFDKLEIQQGNIVSLCLPNLPEVLISLYGLNKIGAVANMIHPLSTAKEIKESIKSTKSKILIIIDIFYNKIEPYLEELNLKKVIIVKASNYMDILTKIGYFFTKQLKNKKIYYNNTTISFKTFLSLSKDNPQINTRYFGRDVPAVIIHSGGTSGIPKNVVIQNRSFVLAAIQERIALNHLRPGDCCLAIMPNFHGFGLSVCMHTPLAIGCYTILVPEFNSRKFDILLKKTKPTCVLGVPTLFEALINSTNVKSLDLSFLKYIISGGDALRPNLEEEINEYLKKHNCKYPIIQGYGLSEALAAVCLSPVDINKKGSIGIPLPGNHIKIIDQATRNILPYGTVGEICIHSKALMQGYLNNEIETNEALQIHKDGHIWLHTGDLGYMDKDGYVFHQGRIKRMIITSGYNVYPSHIEEIIESHPAVLQCTVVGVPHKYKQEVPKAFIVLKDGTHSLLIKNQIKEYCKKNLSPYMVPHEYIFRKKLPKTKLGKVDFLKLQRDIGSDDDE